MRAPWSSPDVATEPILSAPDASVVLGQPFVRSAVIADYWAMTKPDINFLIAITTGTGFCLASAPSFPSMALVETLLGTVLAASGAAVLNQWMERSFDARMRRTARRAVAAGRVAPIHALLAGAGLSCAGVGFLGSTVGRLPAALAIFTLATYLLLYTPLKRLTPLCTAAGAVP